MFEDHLNLATFYRRLSIVIRIGRTAVAISHEPPLLNKLPTSSIDPLLRALVLAVQHIGNVLLTEVQPPLPLDQRFNIIGNRHAPSLNEWWAGGESCGEERCQRPRRSQQRYSVLSAATQT
jgi:hypothetical protein